MMSKAEIVIEDLSSTEARGAVKILSAMLIDGNELYSALWHEKVSQTAKLYEERQIRERLENEFKRHKELHDSMAYDYKQVVEDNAKLTETISQMTEGMDYLKSRLNLYGEVNDNYEQTTVAGSPNQDSGE